MIIAIVPLLVALVGLVIYALSAQPKTQVIGDRMFTCGLLVTLFVVARTVLKLP